MPLLQLPDNIEQLKRLWLSADEILSAGGGVCCAIEIADALRGRWGWTSLPTDEAMASLINLSPKYEIVWAPPIRVILPEHHCVRCSEVGIILTEAVGNQSDGILPFSDAINIIRSFCQQRKCAISSGIPRFSKGFLLFQDDAIEEILADESALYNQYAWALKYGKRRMLIAETILRNAGRAMHFTEVYAEVNKDRPTHGRISEKNIYSYIERSPDLLLWGRGIFIHRDHAFIPIKLIIEIEENLLYRLSSDIPYLSVGGIFELYKDRLLAEGIPSEHALYSSLRESNNPLLSYTDYPYIMKQGSSKTRLPLPLVLEAFVLSQEGIVTWEQIREYAVERMCVNETLFMANHFSNIPNLLRMNRGEYIHAQQLGVNKDRLTPIIDHLTALLGMSSHVSVAKLFKDKRVTCRMSAITTPMLLFSLLQAFYADQFDVSRYPSIRQIGSMAEGRSSGVAAEVINYLRGKNAPCSFAELYEHFVDGLGYEQQSVYNAHWDSQIMRYSEGVVIHLESIGWTSEKQIDLNTLVIIHLHDRQSAGKPFGLIAHIYEYFYDQLPRLPDHIPWTPMLLAELLSRVGNYRIIGTQRNAFVSVSNANGIESLDDLLAYLLDSEYDGAANIDVFITAMREAGILMKSLTPSMLGAESRVTIDRDVVLLSELQSHAT